MTSDRKLGRTTGPGATRALLACVLVASSVSVSSAADERGFGVDLGAGSQLLDARLDDYRWEVDPRPVLGAELWLRRGRLELGAGLDRSSTRQGTGLPGVVTAPRVDLTAATLRARFDLVDVGGVSVGTAAGLGGLHLGWDPDTATWSVDGSATPIRVDYAPVDTWRIELGLRARVTLSGPVSMGVASTWSTFALDTAHRSGDAIVERRERFDAFDARLFLRWSPVGPR